MSNLQRGKARAIEEALIVRGCGRDLSRCKDVADPVLTNRIHSISPTHPYYQEALDWGEDWLKVNGVNQLL